ncbi:MAG: hypothetical protein DRP50_08995 [Thermotoga sp.]|nr:MAG: hypothetical protein DRP50_08995 [Thermotoga sp.]
MQQHFEPIKEDNKTTLGKGVSLEVRGGKKGTAIQYDYGREIKRVDLSDTPAKRIFIVDLVEYGVNQTKLAKVLNISRQTIHNYVERKEIYGLEGLINSYHVAPDTNLQQQRKDNKSKLPTGNINQKLAKLRNKKRIEAEKAEKGKTVQPTLPFMIEKDKKAKTISHKEQPFTEIHSWQSSRYAGVFVYIIYLFSQLRLLTLLGEYFGNSYKIFMVFIMMVSRNIRSLEQLKNVYKREAGLIVGLGRIPSKPKAWEWFYRAAHLNVAQKVLDDLFRYQIRSGLVGVHFLFTDGHLLPYTGKEKVHCGYNTQRGIPFPGQTNMVTCDATGRIVDFDIQEGTGDLRGHISTLSDRWSDDMSKKVIHVFDREGYGADFFYGLREKGVCFVTWDKYVNHGKLAQIPDEQFSGELELNGKKYRYFEQIKEFNVTKNEGVKETFSLRHLILWNIETNRRTAGLAYTADYEISTKDCMLGILNRWGASENTFKHLKDKHPFHYHPGFKLIKSEKQDVANPILKELKALVAKIKKHITWLKVKFIDTKPVFNKDGSERKNSIHVNLKMKISEEEVILKQTREDVKKEPERVNTSDLEDYCERKRINNEGKKLFDLITSCVWNAQKEMVNWIRPHWKLENEIVDLFYAITECHGWIRSTKEEVRVRLEPLEQPSRRSAQEQLCRKLTFLAARLPNGKQMIIEVGQAPK